MDGVNFEIIVEKMTVFVTVVVCIAEEERTSILDHASDEEERRLTRYAIMVEFPVNAGCFQVIVALVAPMDEPVTDRGAVATPDAVGMVVRAVTVALSPYPERALFLAAIATVYTVLG